MPKWELSIVEHASYYITVEAENVDTAIKLYQSGDHSESYGWELISDEISNIEEVE